MKPEGHLEKAEAFEKRAHKWVSDREAPSVIEDIFDAAVHYIAYSINIKYGKDIDSHSKQKKHLRNNEEIEAYNAFVEIERIRIGSVYGGSWNGGRIKKGIEKSGGYQEMEGINWKIMQLKRIFGKTEFDTGLVPPLVLIELETAASQIKGLGALIIFGSVVRGEASVKSDIDLMMVTMENCNPEDVRNELMKTVEKIEKEHKLKISFSIVDSNMEQDPYFSWEVVKDGMILFCKPELLIDPSNRLSAHALISYSYKGLEGRTRKAARRFIFESENGLKIDTNNRMEFIAPGVIILSVDKVPMTERRFEKLGIKYSLLKIWI